MSKIIKKVVLIGLVCVALTAFCACDSSMSTGTSSSKKTVTFTLEIKSENDNYDQKEEVTSDLESLGAYLRTMEECNWVEGDYGIYINGFAGIIPDFNETQEYWAVYVNGEQAQTGADEIMLEDGAEYLCTIEKMEY